MKYSITHQRYNKGTEQYDIHEIVFRSNSLSEILKYVDDLKELAYNYYVTEWDKNELNQDEIIAQNSAEDVQYLRQLFSFAS